MTRPRPLPLGYLVFLAVLACCVAAWWAAGEIAVTVELLRSLFSLEVGG